MDGDHVTKRILKLTLEIIYLLTGEEYAPLKKCGEYVSFMEPQLSSGAYEGKNEKVLDLTNKILHLLTGEVPIRYEDIMVSFTMEEWEYVEGHKDLYKDIIMENPQTFQPLDGSKNTSISDRCQSPLYSLYYTEEDFDISQDSSEKDEDHMTEKEQEGGDCISQQNNEDDNYVTDDSGEDEILSHDWKLEAAYISQDCKQEVEDPTKDCKLEVEDPTKDCKLEVEDPTKDCKQEVEDPTEDCKQEVEDPTEDCKQEVEDPTKDCKQEVEDPTKDCKQEVEDPRKEYKLEEAKKLKDCKYEDNGIEQYYQDEFLKDVKIEVVSDDEWEEEISFWGEQERELFMEEKLDDISPAVSNNRMIAERCPQTFYPHCKKEDGGVSPDYQSPVVPGVRANTSNSQTMLNCHIKNGTATLTNSNARKSVQTSPACKFVQMSQLSSPAAAQDHVQMGQQQKNINTARKTTSDIQTLQNFMSERNENRKVEEIPHTQLDTLLSKFILLVKRKDGNEYEPHTLRCMVGSIDRYLKEHRYNHTIIYGNSKDFPLTKQSLNAKIKFLKKIAESNPPIRQEALTDDDIKNLFKTRTLSLDNPTSLLNLVFFNNGIHFALRTKEQYSLQWGDIKLKIDPRRNQYLEYSDRQTETLENHKNVRQMKPRIYATPRVPDRDPVTAYLKYQSFRPSAMMAPDSPFYLAPNVNYNPAFSEWYRSTKIGIQKIRAMMTTMKIRVSLPESKGKVGYITKRRLVERLPQHTLAASGAMVATTQQNHLQSFTNKSSVMDMKQRKSATTSNLHTALARPSQERLPTTSSIQPHPSTSRYGELPIHKRSFLATEFAPQRNSNMYLNNYQYQTSEEPAKKRKLI